MTSSTVTSGDNFPRSITPANLAVQAIVVLDSNFQGCAPVSGSSGLVTSTSGGIRDLWILRGEYTGE